MERNRRDLGKGFTLVELLVVMGMIAVLTGAMTVAVQSARERARIQRATNDVKVISQAILAYENWSDDGLPTMGARGRAASGVDASSSTLGFLVGSGNSAREGELPVLLQAQLRNGGDIVDPWGTPYKVTIAETEATVKLRTATGTMRAGYWLPNFHWGRD